MPDLEIVFRTKAELEGARQTQASLERQIGTAKALGKDFADLDAQLQKVKASIAAAGKPGPGLGEMFTKVKEGLGEVIPGFAQLDGVLSKLGGGAISAIAGGFALVAGAAESAKHSIEEFAKEEDNVARLDAALAQRAQLTDEYREKLQELAHEMQDTTAVAEEQWLAVLTRLTQFGADSSNINQYAEAVKNLAGILGGDLQTSATLVSRALQGNFQMFARYGIQVQEAGTQTEKLQKLFEDLALRGGGQLEAASKSITGQFKQFTLATADVSKGIGRVIAETGLLQGVLRVVTDAFSYLSEMFAGVVPKVEGLENAVRPTTQTLGEAGAAAQKFADQVKGIKTAGDEAAAGLGKYIAKLNELQALHDKLEDSKMALELARVKESGATGSKALEEEAAIRQKYAEQKFNREQAAIKKEIDLRDNAYVKAAGGVLAASADIDEQKRKIAVAEQIEKADAELKEKTAARNKSAKELQDAEALQRDNARKPGVLDANKWGASYDEMVDEWRNGSPDEQRVKQAESFFNADSVAQANARLKLDKLKEQHPDVAGKSSEDLRRELNQSLKPTLGVKEEQLKQAAENREPNDILRRKLEVNPQIFGATSKASELNSQAEVKKERTREDEEAQRKQERLEKQQEHDREERFRHGFPDVDSGARKIEQGTDRMARELGNLQESITGSLSGLADQIKDIVRDLDRLNSRYESGRQ